MCSTSTKFPLQVQVKLSKYAMISSYGLLALIGLTNICFGIKICPTFAAGWKQSRALITAEEFDETVALVTTYNMSFILNYSFKNEEWDVWNMMASSILLEEYSRLIPILPLWCLFMAMKRQIWK